MKVTSEVPQFIHSQFVEDVTLADRIIEFYHKYPFLHCKGSVHLPEGNYGLSDEDSEIKYVADGHGGVTELPVSTKKKKSTEISISHQLLSFPEFQELNGQIQIILDEYIRIHPQCGTLARFALHSYNIQYYGKELDEGYLLWHSDKSDGTEPFVSRVLVFIFYCYDIENGGGTEFLHQDYLSKSEKGKMIIFPADWEFTHRGVPTNQEKMIVTGWWNFEEQK